MALSIGVNIGSRIMIGEHQLRVKSLSQPNLIVVSLDGGPDVLITDQDKKELLPEVFVFAGMGSNGSGNRLAFIAPRAISIHRVET